MQDYLSGSDYERAPGTYAHRGDYIEAQTGPAPTQVMRKPNRVTHAYGRAEAAMRAAGKGPRWLFCFKFTCTTPESQCPLAPRVP